MGRAMRAAMGAVWETWPDCVMEGHLVSPVTRHLLPYDHTLSPSKHSRHSWNPPDPPMWRPPPVKTPYIDAVSTAIERSYVSGHWHYSWMTSSPQTMPLLMLYMSSNIDQRNIFCSRKRGAWGKEWKRIRKEGRAVAPKKHPRGKKTRREVW